MGIALLVSVITLFFIPINAFALVLTFKAIDPHLNKAEVRLAFFLALKLFTITGILHVLVVAILFIGQTEHYEWITLGVNLFSCILLWKYFVLDVGTFLLINAVYGIINGLLGGLLLGFLAGLLSIAI